MRGADERQLLLRLMGVHGQLDTALKARDWTRFAAIDQNIRECLQALAEREVLSDELLLVKHQLHALHDQALQACAELCEQLRQVLLTHLEHAEGRSAYSRTELLRSGG